MLAAAVSVNHIVPLAPATMPVGAEGVVGVGYSVIASVVGLMTPIWPAPSSVNQTLPSGPAAIPHGRDVELGVANSVMTPVDGSSRPIWSAPYSVNQRLPSGPAVICSGCADFGRQRELGHDAGRRVDHADLIGGELGEPEVAVGTHRDRCGLGM